MAVVSRGELYELVWSKPMTKVAEQLGVSGSYLARVSEALNVPRPPRGYWAKLEVGKAPARPPLPEARPGDQLEWSKDVGLQVRPTARPVRPQPKPARRVPIPKDHVHGLIRGAKDLFESGRPTEDGAYLRPYKRRLVDITTSKASLDKALAFANELFNALESAGHRVVLTPAGQDLGRAEIDEHELPTKPRDRYRKNRLWSPDRPTVVFVGDVAIGLSVVEMSEDVLMRYVGGKYVREADYVPPKRSRYYADHSWTTTEELPCGRLRLTAYSPYRRVNWSVDWRETKQGSLLSSLKSIVKAIEAAAVDLVPKLEEAERQAEIERKKWEETQERWRREEDRRRVGESQRESRDHLGQIIQKWSSVMTVEQFLLGVEQRAAALPEADKVQVLERLRLAREFLGSQDPLDFFLAWKTPTERYRPKYTEG